VDKRESKTLLQMSQSFQPKHEKDCQKITARSNNFWSHSVLPVAVVRRWKLCDGGLCGFSTLGISCHFSPYFKSMAWNAKDFEEGMDANVRKSWDQAGKSVPSGHGILQPGFCSGVRSLHSVWFNGLVPSTMLPSFAVFSSCRSNLRWACWELWLDSGKLSATPIIPSSLFIMLSGTSSWSGWKGYTPTKNESTNTILIIKIIIIIIIIWKIIIATHNPENEM